MLSTKHNHHTVDLRVSKKKRKTIFKNDAIAKQNKKEHLLTGERVLANQKRAFEQPLSSSVVNFSAIQDCGMHFAEGITAAASRRRIPKLTASRAESEERYLASRGHGNSRDKSLSPRTIPL